MCVCGCALVRSTWLILHVSVCVCAQLNGSDDLLGFAALPVDVLLTTKAPGKCSVCVCVHATVSVCERVCVVLSVSTNGRVSLYSPLERVYG